MHKGPAGVGPVNGSVGVPENRQPKGRKCAISPSGGWVLESREWARWFLPKPLSWACSATFSLCRRAVTPP